MPGSLPGPNGSRIFFPFATDKSHLDSSSLLAVAGSRSNENAINLLLYFKGPLPANDFLLALFYYEEDQLILVKKPWSTIVLVQFLIVQNPSLSISQRSLP